VIAGKPQPGVPLAKITILEPDGARALLGLVLLDGIEPFCAEHVQLLVGNDAAERLHTQLRASTNALPKMMLTLPRADTTPLARELATKLQDVHNMHDARVLALMQRVHERARQRNEQWTQARFEEGLAPGSTSPLRAMFVTTRYSTFVQHSTQDLAESLSQLGCET
jgi:hypothetical protein